VAGNLKLAMMPGMDENGKPKEDVRIETRGEGGYFLTSPTPGYEVIEHSLLAVPAIFPAQVELIHSLARTFDQRQRKEQLDKTTLPPAKKVPHAGQELPGGRFNTENTVAALLTRYGWKASKKETLGMGWTRPGKEEGTSGVLLDSTGNFYVWSSNAFPLDSQKSYSAFALFTAYEHGGDFAAAARNLANRDHQSLAPDVVTVKQEHKAEQSGESSNKTVARLAALSPIQYDLVRKDEAKILGIRPATLDRVVKEARKGDKDNDLPFIEVDPWPEPIDPARLLTDIATEIRRFIVCDREISHAVALWVAMTHVIDAVQIAPLAIITAPEKRCGKTLLLTLLGRLVARAIQASSISPAALFRTIDAWGPTLLIDEADAFMKDNEELRGLINSGHTRDSAYVIRTVGESYTPTKFNTWGAKALSGIGHVADTLMDRAVILELRRKMPHEQVDRIRHAEPGLFDDLRAKLARFAEDYSDQVRQARPPLPPSLNDRAQDNWEPLLAIAQVAGGDWLQTGTTAALKLSGSESATQTIGTELLADIKEIFDKKAVGRISTADLIKTLCADDEKPWATYNRGLPIKPRQIANKMKGYGVMSKTIRFNSVDVAKGYEKNQFDEAFLRYIPSTPSVCVTPLQANNHEVLPVTDNPLRYAYVTDENISKQAPPLACNVVTASPHRPASEIVEVEI